jgi:hypothetical protein
MSKLMPSFDFKSNASELHTKTHQNPTRLSSESHPKARYQHYATKHDIFVLS